MGCFPCFDAKGEEKLNHHKERDDRKKVHPTVPSEVSGRKDFPRADTTSRTFTFRKLANATHNFKPECLLRQGEFGRIYKGRLPNGQIFHLIKSRSIGTYARMKIAAGTTKVLEYLHDHASPPVIYGDFKSSYILLGEGYSPKLSNFGLARLDHTGDNSHVSTRLMGTYGYSAPEYAMNGQLSVKFDV